MVNILKDSEFESKIAADKGFVLVDFWAEWCGPCRALAPTLERVSEGLKGKIEVCKINVDEAPNASSTQQIRSIPTLILFKDGKEMNRVSGVLSEDALKKWLADNGV